MPTHTITITNIYENANDFLIIGDSDIQHFTLDKYNSSYLELKTKLQVGDTCIFKHYNNHVTDILYFSSEQMVKIEENGKRYECTYHARSYDKSKKRNTSETYKIKFDKLNTF